MKKKGFTLVEIIISIGLIVFIGIVSIVSFNLVKKNNKTKTLDAMSEEIYTAVNLYIETNNEVKDELYENNNGLKIPLITLENAGLVDFQDIELDEEDYVVTMLGSTEEDDDHCANTYTAKSWNITSGETIYICEKSNGTQNLVAVAGDADNLSKASRDVYYFRGVNAQNYAQIDGDSSTTYRILAVDKDDSIILYSTSDFSSSVKNMAQKTVCYSDGEVKYVLCNESTNIPYISTNGTISSTDYSCSISAIDIINSMFCVYQRILITSGYGHAEYSKPNGSSFISSSITDYTTASGNSNLYYLTVSNKSGGYKLQLKSSVKIVSGTGSYANPYILENKG